MINPNWSRWIFASTTWQFIQSGYFIDWFSYRKKPSYYDNLDIIPVFIEGQVFDPDEVKHYVELRLDGPQFTELSKDYYRTKLEVNALVTVPHNTPDFHAIHRYTGRVQSVMGESITIYRFGDGEDDDGSPLECMSTLMWTSGERGNRVNTHHFGQIDPNIPLVQASVEVHYETDLQS